MLLRLLCTTAALLVLAAPPRALHAQSCVLEYQRADNMWAAFGRPDGALGVETITLAPGTARVFVTDWKYEKTRNDGTNYYGSHGRTHHNRGTRPVKITYKPGAASVRTFYLDPGQSSYTSIYFVSQVIGGHSGDIVEVACP